MEKQPILRYSPNPSIGLTEEQVQQRVAQKQTNKVKKVVGKSYVAIVTSNVLTFFNLLGFIIFVIYALCGSFDNMAFVAIISANTLLGIIQEIRSKIAVERLAIVHQPTIDVVRNGKQQTIATKDVVLDEVVVYSAGKQICADGIVLEGQVEVNESMLTGESVAVKKVKGDVLYSGSYVVSGNCTALADKVGKECYVEKLSARVKRTKAPNSQLMKGIGTIIKFISIIIFPLGIATFFTSAEMLALYPSGWGYIWQGIATSNPVVTSAIVNSVKSAAGCMIGMVPSGMVLLTSTALAVSAFRLAGKNVLVREMACIEMLARVDTLCLDKTGTITDGTMTVQDVVVVDDRFSQQDVEQMLASLLFATKDDNSTAQALKQHLEGVAPLETTAHVAFSSARKYSMATVQNFGTVAMGASEFMFKHQSQQFNDQCNSLLQQGLRVLAVGLSQASIVDDAVDQPFQPIAIVVLQDTIRSDATEIIAWFKQNNVAVKVISGDNPVSVSAIAMQVGVENADRYISLEGMTDEQVAQVATQYTVFGRVTPDQKAILVRSMKDAGATVAMTGDGVNDILAMRESDCAISVGCGSDAAKTVAHLVLTDSKFSSMPNVVAHGRQVVNNIQNSSSLFLMKTSMTILTTITLLFLPYTYPFQAKHLYAIEFFVIGIASAMLAVLKPNKNLIKGNFLKNVLSSTLPSGVAMYLAVALTYVFVAVCGIQLSAEQISTIAMFAMTFTGLVALLILLYPYDKFNLLVAGVASVGTAAVFLTFPWIFQNVLGVDLQLFVAIPPQAIVFVVVTPICLGAVIVCGNLLLKKLAQKGK